MTPPRVSLRRIQWSATEHTVRLAQEAAGGRGRGCAGATLPGRRVRRWGRRGTAYRERRRAALAGAREEVSWRPRNSARGGWGSGWAPNRGATSAHTVPLAKPGDTTLRQTAFSSSGRSKSHRAPQAPQQQREKGDSVRGVDMCRSCIDEGDGNTADTGIYRGGELQAARTVPQRTGHGAPNAAPKLETQRLASEPASTFQG